jgi:hypothetical protein
MLWSFHKLDLCCCIVEAFAMYIAGRTPTHSGCITIYIGYHPTELTPDSSILFQITRAPAFSLNCLDFQLVPEFTIPGSVISYIVKYGASTLAVKIECVYSNIPCGPRSNLNLVHYLWSEFVYYCSNYGLFVLPSLTSGDKLVYVRYYKAEIGGSESRSCRECIWGPENPETLYNISCKKPNPCTCILCVKQPPTLKSLALKIFFPVATLYKNVAFRTRV